MTYYKKGNRTKVIYFIQNLKSQKTKRHENEHKTQHKNKYINKTNN